MTGQVATGTRAPLAVWLIGLYIVALLVLPVDFGVKVGGVVLTPARLVLLAAVAHALVERPSLLAALRRVPIVVWVGWTAFLGAALVTAITVPSTGSWVRYASLVLEGVVVFALVCKAASAPGGLRTLVTAFAVTMVVVTAVVLLLAILGLHYDYVLSGLVGSAPAPGIAVRYGFERQAGPFRGAVYFGIWLTAASALLLPALADDSRRMRAVVLAAWLLLLGSVVVLTASRLAMTTMFLVPAAYFLARGPRLIGIASLIAAGAVALSFLLTPADPVIGASTTMRLSAIDAALQAIRERPLFGWGLLNDMAVLRGIIGSNSYVDDTYLSLAVETGLVGLGAFVLLAAGILAATRRGWNTAVGLALAIALLSVLGMGALASVLQASQSYAAFFVLAALGVVAARDAARSAGSLDPRGAAASVAA